MAAHEIGHALGLAHSNVAGSLMYPWYQGYTPSFQLHSDDIVAVQYLYGKYSTFKQAIKYNEVQAKKYNKPSHDHKFC